MDNLALLVLDMQDGFLKAVHDRERLTARIRFAVEAANLLGIRVLATEQNPGKLGGTTALIRAVMPGEPAPFPKSAFSAFGCEAFRATLGEHGIDHLLLTGIEVLICLFQTATHALRENIDVTVLTDCVSGRRPGDFPAVFEEIRHAGAHLLLSEAVFYSILANAEDSRFRDFTRLVKAAT